MADASNLSDQLGDSLDHLLIAGNPYFIDLDILCTKKLLKKSECKSYQWNEKTIPWTMLFFIRTVMTY